MGGLTIALGLRLHPGQTEKKLRALRNEEIENMITMQCALMHIDAYVRVQLRPCQYHGRLHYWDIWDSYQFPFIIVKQLKKNSNN